MRLLCSLFAIATCTFVLTPSVAGAHDLRTWTSSVGDHTLEAKFVETMSSPSGDLVVWVVTPQGKKVRLDYEALIEKDQQYVEKLRQQAVDGKGSGKSSNAPGSEASDDSDKKAKALKLLRRRRLQRLGDYWVLKSEFDAARELQTAIRWHEKIEKIDKKFSERKRNHAKKTVAELYKRQSQLADASGIYSTHTSESEHKERYQQFSEKVKRVRKQLEPAINAADSVEQWARSRSSDLTNSDAHVQRTDRGYRDLTDQADVLAAIDTLGGKLGPHDNYGTLLAKLDKFAGEYLGRAERRSKTALAMDLGLPLTSKELSDLEESPAAFLEALGLQRKKKQWTLRGEEEMILDVEDALAIALRVEKLTPLASASQQRKLAKVMKDTEALVQSTRNQLEALTEEYQNNGVPDREYDPLAKKYIQARAKVREIKGRQKSHRKIVSELKSIAGYPDRLYRRAHAKALRIQDRYDELAADAKAVSALESVDGTMRPSSRFTTLLKRTEATLRKLDSDR